MAVFPKFFEALPDRRRRAEVLYPLDEILLPCLLAVLAGAETTPDIAGFGETKRRPEPLPSLRRRHPCR